MLSSSTRESIKATNLVAEFNSDKGVGDVRVWSHLIYRRILKGVGKRILALIYSKVHGA